MKKFIRTKEDFVCKYCNQMVKGNGYTNHCPECLYSLHVDNYPGDRQVTCGGLMMPIDIITKGGEPKYVVQKCLICKVIKRNILSSKDSSQAIISVMKDKVAREMMR